MITFFLERKQPGGEKNRCAGDAHARAADGGCVQLYDFFVEVKRLALDVRRGEELRRFAAREVLGYECEQSAVELEPLWEEIVHEAFARCTFIPDQVKDLLRQQHEQCRNDRA